MEAVCNQYNVIARIYNDFTSKFGIPRQSCLVNEVESVIIFEPPYRSQEAIRGLEEYNYLWLIWVFSKNGDSGFRPTVRPPRLGGNKRVGVFATRSPYRPNPIGLSSVKLSRIVNDSGKGPLLYVTGADLMNETPILDIKPYIPYADIHNDARSGFTQYTKDYTLSVGKGLDLLDIMQEDKALVLKKILMQDPRPAYHNEPDRVYGFEYGEYHIEFTVDGDTLNICRVNRLKDFDDT